MSSTIVSFFFAFFFSLYALHELNRIIPSYTVSAVHLSPAQFLHFDGDMIKNHMHASREREKMKIFNSAKAENNPGLLQQQQQTLSH